MASTLSRLATALLPAAGGFLRGLGRLVRQLGHEVAGALFAVLTVVGAASAWRVWQQESPGWVVAVSVGFAAMMGYFAASSFRRAYKS